MIKIKVSYEKQEELQQLIKKLGGTVNQVKIPKQYTGKYRKAYIALKE